MRGRNVDTENQDGFAVFIFNFLDSLLDTLGPKVSHTTGKRPEF